MQKLFLLVIFLFLSGCLAIHAQDNYEIQVYGSDTVAPRHTMVELHSNITLSGFKITYNATRKLTVWFEYYGSAGPNFCF